MTNPDTPSAKPSLETADMLNTRISQVAYCAEIGAESAFCQPAEILPLLTELRELRAQVTELRAALAELREAAMHTSRFIAAVGRADKTLAGKTGPPSPGIDEEIMMEAHDAH